MFLSSPLVLSLLTTAVIVVLSGSGSRYAIKYQIGASTSSNLAPRITKILYFKLPIYAGLNGPPPVFSLFCLQLAL